MSSETTSDAASPATAPAPNVWKQRAPGFGFVAVLAAIAWLAASTSSALSPLVVGVALGALVANVAPIPDSFAPGITWAAKQVLRMGIVLLGLRLSLGDLGELGARGLVVVTAVVATTFFGTQWLARRFGIGDDLGLLIATGYSICGASAIAAVNGTVRADDDETAYAITLVTLCGSLSIIVLPAIGTLLGLDDATFGTWVGGAVHDVGQVVATASTHGDEAVETATVVKLTRVVLLAPLVALVALNRRKRDSEAAAATGEDVGSRPPILPLFVAGFLAMIVVRTTDVLSDDVLDVAADLEKILLTVALVGLGLGVRVAKMRKLGGRPLVVGLLAWVLVAGVAGLATPVTKKKHIRCRVRSVLFAAHPGPGTKRAVPRSRR
ncbi:MAG: YeiH family protein [Actinomycetota bacterium]